MPIVALSTVLAKPASAINTSVSRTVSSAPGERLKRRTRRAPATASSVLPAEMPRAASTGTSADALTARAASATAGQSESPPSSSAASAIPEGAHTAAATPLTASRLSPSFPMAK